MSITKASILSFVNTVLRRNPAETDVDDYIKLALEDLSDLHLLKTSDSTGTLTNLSTYMAYPGDALDDEQAIISITLWDSSLNRLWPLDRIEGGWREYQRLMEDFSTATRSQPTTYVCQNRRIYVYPPPNGDYTSEVWYCKRHADTADAIEFTDSWRRALKFGTAFEFATAHKLADYITIWGGRYELEKDKQRMIHSDSTTIVGG